MWWVVHVEPFCCVVYCNTRHSSHVSTVVTGFAGSVTSSMSGVPFLTTITIVSREVNTPSATAGTFVSLRKKQNVHYTTGGYISAAFCCVMLMLAVRVPQRHQRWKCHP